MLIRSAILALLGGVMVHAAQVNADTLIFCSGNLTDTHSSPTGPVSASVNCGASQATSTADYGYLSVSGSTSAAFSSDHTAFGPSGTAYASGSYVDSVSIVNGPSSGYIRMFYDLSYATTLNRGPWSDSFYSIETTFYLAGTPLSFSSHTSAFSGNQSGFVDFAYFGGVALPDGNIYGSAHCETFVFGSGSDSCDAAFAAVWQITGYQVLDTNHELVSEASIQSSAYSTATPEPSTAFLLLAGALVGARRLRQR